MHFRQSFVDILPKLMGQRECGLFADISLSTLCPDYAETRVSGIVSEIISPLDVGISHHSKQSSMASLTGL